MTLIKRLLILSSVLLFVGCDKNFKEINTDPFATTNIDPAFLFAGAEQVGTGGWETENTIAQQFVNPFNLGATTGPNFNEDNDNFNNGTWNNYTGSIKNLVQALALLDGSNRENLKSMIRIWKANVFMMIVDTYGNVPYFDAGKAYLKGIFYPKYDDAAAIYGDLEKELKEATTALNPSGDFVPEDLFFGAHGSTPSGDAATQVAKWKKVGYSLLLRLGMRYSKVDPSKASAIVTEAFNGGVMTSNADNVYVTYDGTNFINTANNGLFTNNPYYYYAAEPFVNQLKATNDPRTPCLIARFNNPAQPFNDPNPNTTISEQYGVPIGVTSTLLKNPPYRGAKGAGFDYSQMNVNCIASLTAPTFWITYAQTSLLLAEAAHRGWIQGGDAQAQTYYENGVKADMDNYAKYGHTISTAEEDAYLSQAGVAYDPANALKQINTQYWIACIRNGSEAWANLRRSGFALIGLSPNLYNNNLNGGFIRRLSYPDYELSNNPENYQEAVASMGGSDDLVTRIFWDK